MYSSISIVNPALEIKNEVDQHLISVLRIVIYTVGNIFIYNEFPPNLDSFL